MSTPPGDSRGHRQRAGQTQEDIGDEVGVDDDTVSVFLQKIQKTGCGGKSEKSANHEDVDFIGDGWAAGFSVASVLDAGGHCQ